MEFAASRSDSRVVRRQADAQHLPFPDDSFDVIVCQFGVMFFPHKVAAYREARRVLKLTGRYLFTVWDTDKENALSLATSQAVRAYFQDDPPHFLSRDPFLYSDAGQIRQELRTAGFSSTSVETVVFHTHVSSPMDIAIGVCQGTALRPEVEARGPALLSRLANSVADAFSSRFGSGPFDVKLRALLFTTSP